MPQLFIDVVNIGDGAINIRLLVLSFGDHEVEGGSDSVDGGGVLGGAERRGVVLGGELGGSGSLRRELGVLTLALDGGGWEVHFNYILSFAIELIPSAETINLKLIEPNAIGLILTPAAGLQSPIPAPNLKALHLTPGVVPDAWEVVPDTWVNA